LAVFKAEKVMLFNDQLSKYVLYDSIFLFADRGGFETDCGVHGGFEEGYSVWKKPGKDCLPAIETLKSRLRGVFASEFEISLARNPYFVPKQADPFQNFEYSVDVDGDKLAVRGYPYMPLAHNIICEYGGELIPINILEKPVFLLGHLTIGYTESEKTRSVCGRYAFRPSFSHNIDYSLGDYLTIAEKANETYNSCKESTDMIKCVTNQAARLNTGDLAWNLTSYSVAEGGIAFDFEVTQRNFRFDLYAKPVIRFAIVIPVAVSS
jgi:hypothetical protein